MPANICPRRRGAQPALSAQNEVVIAVASAPKAAGWQALEGEVRVMRGVGICGSGHYLITQAKFSV